LECCANAHLECDAGCWAQAELECNGDGDDDGTSCNHCGGDDGGDRYPTNGTPPGGDDDGDGYDDGDDGGPCNDGDDGGSCGKHAGCSAAPGSATGYGAMLALVGAALMNVARRRRKA
ncbi:MAG: hypothetical protein HOW73_17965, partial [Polyangiaceae bacterium]|nr:hypothetical protein [Polyangiaceae bacterium]